MKGIDMGGSFMSDVTHAAIGNAFRYKKMPAYCIPIIREFVLQRVGWNETQAARRKPPGVGHLTDC